MPHDLEAPVPVGSSDWGRLYRARGDEVGEHRHVFTGDVFTDTPVLTPKGDTRTRTVMLVQHPCALRSNGIDLVSRLLVVEVRPNAVIPAADWARYGRLMPLPDVEPAETGNRRHQAAFFDAPYLVEPPQLGTRIACLEPIGVNLVLQRWVHHNSRVVIETHMYNEVSAGPYEEADITEDWCGDRISSGLGPAEAAAECLAWLREPDQAGGPLRQALLSDPQQRAAIRQAARRHIRTLSGHRTGPTGSN